MWPLPDHVPAGSFRLVAGQVGGEFGRGNEPGFRASYWLHPCGVIGVLVAATRGWNRRGHLGKRIAPDCRPRDVSGRGRLLRQDNPCRSERLHARRTAAMFRNMTGTQARFPSAWQSRSTSALRAWDAVAWPRHALGRASRSPSPSAQERLDLSRSRGRGL
jgi:hypothetical protein